MAEIYLGKAVGDDAFQRIVAIKRILPHFARDKEFVAMFRDEAHICKRLQHANIVQVYDFTEVDDSFALIMEHVDGADFRTLLAACETANRRLALPQVVYIIACAARGLHYAHTKVDEITHKPLGIVHRDISPQNILISYEGEVKITDFGIASADDKVTETRPGIVKGKYSYMSPEQVAAKHLDGRSDVFSLAIVLWEALAMKRLFAGKSEVETLRKVQNCEIPDSLTKYNSDVTEELAQIVGKGLEREPKNRYQTAAEFEKALLKFLNSNYPEFLSSQLGDFLKQILADRWDQSREIRKNTLTNHDHSGMQKAGGGSTHTKSRKELNIAAISTQSQIKLVAQPNSGGAGSNSTGAPNSAAAASAPQARSKLQTLQTAVHLKPTLKKNSRVPRLLIPAVALALVGTTIWLNKERFFSTRQVRVDIKTEPKEVQILINGKNIHAYTNSDNSSLNAINLTRFTTTPKEIVLPDIRDAQKVDIMRPGYITESFMISPKEGSAFTKNIKLTKNPTFQLVDVKITSDSKILVDVDYGLQKGVVPLVAENILSNRTHLLNIKTAAGDKHAQCRFQVPAVTGQVNLEVVLEPTVRCIPRSSGGSKR